MKELAAGTMVTPSVRLVRLLGEGAMGSVWVADHTSLDTQVAVKFISHTKPKDRPKVIARFEREAKAAARIKSPHVVHMYDHGVMGGDTPYIVMELLEGETLGERIRRTGRLKLREVRTVVTHVSKALARAHKLGIVHRDIKPDNIFLTGASDDLFVKVLDFGIAKSTAEEPGHTMTQTGAILGTPIYMSPEVVKSAKGADARADLWALAVVAYESVTGRPPFEGETVGALFFSICGDAIEPPSATRDDVPQALDDWFSRALRQEADKRFATARELSTTFRKALQQADDTDAQPAPIPAATTVDDDALATQDFVAKHQLQTEVVTAPDVEPETIERDKSTLEGAAVAEPAAPRSSRRRTLAVAAGATLLAGGLAAAWINSVGEPIAEPNVVTPAAADSAALAAASDSAPPPSAVASASASAKPGKLDREIVKAIIDTRMDEIGACYREGRKKVPGLVVDADLKMRIDEDGIVDRAELEGMDHEPTRRCIEKEVAALRFPTPGGTVNVTYPLKLKRPRKPPARPKGYGYGNSSNVGSLPNLATQKTVSSKKQKAPPPQQQQVQQQKQQPFEFE